jgi:hypothetical protein
LEQIEDSGDTREHQQLNDALGALFTMAARKAICLSSVLSASVSTVFSPKSAESLPD